MDEVNSEKLLGMKGLRAMFDGAYPPGVTGKMIDDYFEGLDSMCCGNCSYYDGTYCMKEWNNMDRDYCVPDRDEKDEDDYCKDWEEQL